MMLNFWLSDHSRKWQTRATISIFANGICRTFLDGFQNTVVLRPLTS